MTDDERLARLTDLARGIWPEPALAGAYYDEGRRAGVVGLRGMTIIEIRHPRSLDALEAALQVLASGETWQAVYNAEVAAKLADQANAAEARIAELEGQLEAAQVYDRDVRIGQLREADERIAELEAQAQAMADVVVTLQARIAELEAQLAAVIDAKRGT